MKYSYDNEREEILLNRDELCSVIRANLSEYHNQPVTPDLIAAVARQLSEDIEKMVNA
jgi:hypothetical protein